MKLCIKLSKKYLVHFFDNNEINMKKLPIIKCTLCKGQFKKRLGCF